MIVMDKVPAVTDESEPYLQDIKKVPPMIYFLTGGTFFRVLLRGSINNLHPSFFFVTKCYGVDVGCPDG
jgi:hypothetical protein